MSKKLLALVVEDMEDLACLMVREMEHFGWETTKINNLEEALIRIKEHPYFDFVFLDLNLPRSSPMETVSHIMEIMKYSPVAVTSGYDSPEIVSAVEATGAIFIAKRPPPGQETFLKTIVRTLGWYKTKRTQRITQELAELRAFLINTVR